MYRVLTLVLLLGCFTVDLSNAADQPQGAGVSLPTAKAQLVTQPLVRAVDASFEAVHQATVSAQVSGRITDITVDVDDFVQKGTVIIRLRGKEQEAAYNAAKARFDEAEKEYKRVTDIFQRGLVAKAALDAAEAKFKSAKAALAQASESLENTQIRAPYSGIVTKRYVQVGEMATVGKPLIAGLSMEKLRAVVELPQSLIYAVRQRKKAWVLVGKDGQTRLAAESLQISSSSDPQTHTFTVKLNLPSGDHGVYPGMSTKALFMVGEEQQLAIPKVAVARRSEVTGVYLKTATGLQFTQIRLGDEVDANLIAIQAGLKAGDEVVLDPVQAAALIHLQPKKD